MSFKLITLVVIVLGVLAVAQLVRLYELSSKLRNRREEDVPNRDNKFNANMMLVFMVLSYIGFFYLMFVFGWTGRGESASEHGVVTDWLLNLNFIIIFAVFFLTNTLLFYFAYKYVRKPGVKAYFYPHNNKLELLWTVVPALVLAIIIILGLRTWNDVTSVASDEAIRIELFSKQFDWTARYSGKDNKLGKFDYKLTTQENELALMTTETLESSIKLMEFGSDDGSVQGIQLLEDRLNNPNNVFSVKDREQLVKELESKQRLLRLLYQMKERHDSKLDALAYDDVIQKDTLHLLVDKEYEITFRAKDVIHSAHFPHFRAQMNTVPGLVTRLKMKPTITTKEMKEKMNNPDFNYVLLCNKICGGAHYKMKMMVVVDTPEQYEAWMKSKSTFKQEFFKEEAVDTKVEASDSLKLAVK
jgi:cytochrome c oxidase subunit II